MNVTRLAAIAVGAVGGCGGSGSDEVADLQAQLDEAHARADAAEAERDELAEQLDAPGSTPTTSVDSGADTGDAAQTTATEPTVADTPDTTAAPASSAPATTAAPVGGIAAPDASQYVAGFGDLSVLQLPDGEPGQVTVIVAATELDSSGSLPVILRNNTAEAVGQIDVTGRARNNGDLVGSGSSRGARHLTLAFGPPAVVAGELPRVGSPLGGASSP